MPLPNGTADVWLRTNICQVDTEELCWRADEIYLHTDRTLEEIVQNFDSYFVKQPTDTERIEMMEDAFAELCGVIFSD